MSESKKGKSWPRRPKVTIRKGAVEVAVDTGAFIHVTRRHRRKSFALPKGPVTAETLFSKLEKVLQDALKDGPSPPWPDYIQKEAEELLLEISEARNFLKILKRNSSDRYLDALVETSFRIGRAWERLLVRDGHELEVQKRRNSDEATRGPRSKSKLWLKVEEVYRDYLRKGIKPTSREIWHRCRPERESTSITYDSFKTQFSARKKTWQL